MSSAAYDRAAVFPQLGSPTAAYTGLTRQDWEAHADLLLEGAHRCARPSHARISFPGRSSAAGADMDGLEGFARTFLLAAFRIAGDRGTTVRAAELIDRYSSGLTAGSDPGHPDAWPRIAGERPSQPMVEAASVALGLHVSRPWLWDRLAPSAQARIVDWMAGFVGRWTWPNNWVLFQSLVEEFLASVGGPYREDEILRGLDAIETWYLGDGWYTDGDGRRIDHYNAWAFHLYPLFWTSIAAGGARADRAAELRERYRDRLRSFLRGYVHLVGGDGSPMHQGRSLIYRYATATPFWVGAMFDCLPFSAGVARRAASGMLGHFTRHSVPDRNGLLSLGWRHEFLPMTQEYSGPGSPYWASKAYCGLLLPGDHPVWTAPEELLPVERGDRMMALPSVGWLAQGTRNDGIVRLHNHGSDRNGGVEPESDDPHYAKLAYSTRSAPQTAPASWRRGTDGQFVLLEPGTDTASHGALRRGRIHPLLAACEGSVGHAASWHTPFRRTASGEAAPATECRVETHTIAWDRHEIRVHFVTAPAGWRVRDGGYSLGHTGDCEALLAGGWQLARRSDGTTSAIATLLGYRSGGFHHDRGADAIGSRSTVPYLEGAHASGAQVYVSRVLLSADPAALPAVTDVGLEADRTQVTLTLPGVPIPHVVKKFGRDGGPGDRVCR